jgi:hypothetical protein
MEGIPLTNGRYEDAAPRLSGEGLRVWGQKDVKAGNAHLWIDNRRHTWRAAVDGRTIPAAHGEVGIEMGRFSAPFEVTWYDTRTGEATRTERLRTDENGLLMLVVSALETDVAARIAPIEH